MPNPKRFKFARSRTTNVEQVEQGLLKTVCHLNDTLTEMRVEVLIKIPDMEIKEIRGDIHRCFDSAERHALDLLPEVVGVRVGPGMSKIFKGMVGEEAADTQLLFMVEEACHGVILSSTKDMATMGPNEDDLPAELFRELAKANTRLVGRCAAYAEDSPMVKGVIDAK